MCGFSSYFLEVAVCLVALLPIILAKANVFIADVYICIRSWSHIGRKTVVFVRFLQEKHTIEVSRKNTHHKAAAGSLLTCSVGK